MNPTPQSFVDWINVFGFLLVIVLNLGLLRGLYRAQKREVTLSPEAASEHDVASIRADLLRIQAEDKSNRASIYAQLNPLRERIAALESETRLINQSVQVIGAKIDRLLEFNARKGTA